MSSALTPTINIVSAAIYTMVRPTGSVIDANPTATIIGLECPSHEEFECNQDYTNTFVVGPWASTVVPEGSASTGTFHFYLANSHWGTALSVECLMSSGMPQTCTSLVTEMQTRTWKGGDIYGGPATYSGTALATRFTYMPIVITAGQEFLGEATATSTDTASPEKTNGAGSNAVWFMGAIAIAVITSLLVN